MELMGHSEFIQYNLEGRPRRAALEKRDWGSGNIIIMAEGTNEVMKVVDIDRVAVLEGDPETRPCEVNDSNTTAYAMVQASEILL